MVQSLFLIRHGQTEWSLSGRHTGRTDIPLTTQGEDEVRRLAGWLQGRAFSLVLSSPRQRARRTAELAGLGAHVEIDADLAEWDYGDYEGEVTANIRRLRPRWNLFTDGCPGGESPAQVAARADRVIGRLRATEGKIIVCSHGHFLCALVARWIGLAMCQGEHFYLDTASLSILGYHQGNPGSPVVLLWNVKPGTLEDRFP